MHRSVVVVIFALLGVSGGETVEMHGPRFVREPPSEVDFSNSTGISVECVAKGVPAAIMEWTRTDGSPVVNVHGLRLVLTNGTLHFPPFRAEDYRQDVHASVYACVATNPFGKIISRDVKLRAVVQQYYEAQVYDEFVIRGSTAVFRCQIPSFVLDYVIVTSWIRETSNSVQAVIESGGRFTVFPNGILHIRDVSVGDRGRHYRCRTQHRLTGEVRLSTTAGKLIITEPQSSVPPRITHSMGMVEAIQGDAVELPCAAQGFPNPNYTWMKVKDSLFHAVTLGERILQLGGNLLLRNVQMADSATYVCIVNNSVGLERIETTLFVTALLSARIQPSVQLVDVDKTASMTCVVSGYPVTSISWLKDGRPISVGGRFKSGSKESLRIETVRREDRGMYQCSVRNTQMSAQGTAELKLGDAVPLLQETFSPQLLSPGQSVSLKCVVSGNPPPQISWTLDDEPLPKKINLFVADYINIHGDVISQVNISQLRTEDGGKYECVGNNKVGKTEHSARINVTGSPFIRPMSNVSVVAGRSAHLKCRVAGHPVESIYWERGGSVLPANHRQKVYSNGSLFIVNVQQTVDAGSYVCLAQSPNGHTTRRKVHVFVLNAPMISPFSFADNLRVGMRAGVTCLITEGDLPINIEWFKDNQPIAMHLGITVRNIDEYTSNLVIASISQRHNGNYTCSATNTAATVQFTAKLLVKVPARWSVEPKDGQVILHKATRIDCQADGFPVPAIKWKKATGHAPGDYREISADGSDRSVSRNGSLVIHRAEQSDEGYFLCQASNGIGAELSKLIFLDVQIPAYFQVKQQNQTVIKGETGSLVCIARGDATINIVWWIQGTKVNSDSRVEIEETVLSDGVQSKLTINKVGQQDFATFTCHASNPFGSDETNIHLIVQDVPGIPRLMTTSKVTSRSVLLNWQPPHDGNSPVQRYIVQYKVGEGTWFKSEMNLTVANDKTWAHVDGLVPATNYELRVMAENHVGVGNATSVVAVTTKQEEPSGVPLSIHLEPVTSQSLRVSWKPPHKEMWNGELEGYNIGYRGVDSDGQFLFKTTDHRPGDNVYLISSLRKFTRYGVVIAAFNSVGSGPQSDEMVATTLEDVPSEPPQDVLCSTNSAQTVLVSWKPPPPKAIHGLLQGYKVYYSAPEGHPDKSSSATKSLQVELINLQSFTNYTIRVVAYTRVGDGSSSDPVYCQTLEDVPDAPARIKALVMSSDAILVSWLPPLKPNGIITKYTIFLRQSGHHQQEVTSHSLPAVQLYFEARGLTENFLYEFWVSASTSVGEGGKTRIVSQTPTSIVPAKIASFAERNVLPQKTDLKLPCRSVGIPTPDREWRTSGKKIQEGGRLQLMSDGSLVVTAVRSSDSGNYTCRIYNIYATDEVTHELIVHANKERKGPPMPPVVKVFAVSTSALAVSWFVEDDGSSDIEGYTLNYKRAGEAWEDVHLDSSVTNHTLSGLECGTRYQVYMSAHNRLGPSGPSELVLVTTRGRAPSVPTKDALVSVNSTFFVLNLDAWMTDDPETCKVRYLSIEYRPYTHREWTLLTQTIRIDQGVYVIGDLVPGTAYVLRITAHSDVGLTVADYDLLLPEEHGSLPDSSLQNYGKRYRFYLDMNIIISVAVVISLLVMAFAIGCYFVHRRQYTGYKHGSHPKQQKYVETDEKVKFQKTPGGAMIETYSPICASRRKEPVNLEAAVFSPSGVQDDICPYATYQLPGCLSEDADAVELRTFCPSSYPKEMLQSTNLPVNVIYSKVNKPPKPVKLEMEQSQNKDNAYDMQLQYEKYPTLTKIYSESTKPTAPPAEHDSEHNDKMSHLKNKQFHRVPDLLYHQQEYSTSNESSPVDSDVPCSSRSNSHCSSPETLKDDSFNYPGALRTSSYPNKKEEKQEENNVKHQMNQDNETKRLQAVKLAAAEEELIALLKR